MKKFKDQIKIIFNQTKEISCPAFSDEKVSFNAKGINHLIYKGKKHFWSVIPAWRKDRFGIVNAKRRNLEG